MPTTSATASRAEVFRHLSDGDVASRIAALAFEVEALTDAGPFGVPPGGAPKALNLARRLETLAGETAAERPPLARTLRTAAADLRRAAEASGPAEAYLAFSEALRLLESL